MFLPDSTVAALRDRHGGRVAENGAQARESALKRGILP
jgi:hypothetical protein